MNVQGWKIGEIVEKLEEIIRQHHHNLNAGAIPSSGYFTVTDFLTGKVMFVCQIGLCPKEYADKNLHLSLEKAAHLFSHPEHVSSRQRTDLTGWKFAGAISIPQLILSFNGLQSEDDDEAVMILLAEHCGWNVFELEAIGLKKQNDRFSKLSALFEK
jgi:hypothetical protein